MFKYPEDQTMQALNHKAHTLTNNAMTMSGYPNHVASNDNMVDLSMLFTKLKHQQLWSREYLSSFLHQTLFWDQDRTSTNLEISSMDEPRHITTIESLDSFKSTYG